MLYTFNRFVILFSFLGLTLVTLNAQLPEKGDWKTRLGTKDPTRAKFLFNDVVFPKSSPIFNVNDIPTLGFYVQFREMLDLAPYCDYELYSGTLYEDNGTSLYKRLLDNTSDPAVRMMLVEDVISIGNRFVSNIDSINVLRENNKATKGLPLKMPLAMIKRAHNNYLYAHNPQYYPEHLYDKTKAYNLYREAFKAFRDSKDSQGKELHAFYVLEYFKVCYELYKSDENLYYEQFLNDYLELVEVCDKLLIPYDNIADSIKNNVKDSTYALFRDYNSITKGVDIQIRDTIINGQFIEYYDTIPYGIKPLFKASGAGSPENLRKYFTPRLIDNYNNAEFLNSSIHFMYENEFTRDSLFFRYCEASYNLEPTFENCIGYASFMPSDSVGKKKKIDCYLKALNKSSSEVDKTMIRFYIALSLYTERPKRHDIDSISGKTILKNYGFTTKEYLDWENGITTCNRQLELLLENKELLLNHPKKIAARNMPAQAYYMLGVNSLIPAVRLYNVKMLDEAINYFRQSQALGLDQSQPINGRKVNIAQMISTANRYKSAVNDALIEQRNNDKRQREYQEYLRNKKAEEEFWSNN